MQRASVFAGYNFDGSSPYIILAILAHTEYFETITPTVPLFVIKNPEDLNVFGYFFEREFGSPTNYGYSILDSIFIHCYVILTSLKFVERRLLLSYLRYICSK